jgi:hypothetical protein
MTFVQRQCKYISRWVQKFTSSPPFAGHFATQSTPFSYPSHPWAGRISQCILLIALSADNNYRSAPP